MRTPSIQRAHLSLAGVATLALLIGFLPMEGADSSSATPGEVVAAEKAANRRAAKKEAARTLAAFRIPPSARREPNFPSRVQELLRAGEPAPTNVRILKRHRDWLVPGKPREVLRWLVRHQASGWGEGQGGGYGSPRGRSFSVYLHWKHEVDGLFGKNLLIVTTRLPDDQTAVRAQAQAIWLLPRSPADRVPATARHLTISVEQGGEPPSSISTSNAAFVGRLAKLVNAQQLVQLQYPSCGPELPPGTVTKLFRLEFRAQPDGPLLAAASQETPAGPCQPLYLEVDGRKAAALEGGFLVVDKVRGLIRHIYR
jgi:hypothetical protein